MKAGPSLCPCRLYLWCVRYTAAKSLVLLLAIHTGSAQDTPAQFSANSRLVLAPVRVTDRLGKSVDGLTAGDFELYDQGAFRRFDVETTFAPISLVVAIQSSVISGPALAKIQKIGSLIQPLVLGERGHAAILTYSEKLTLRQDFTSDPTLISAAFRAIEPDGGGAAMHDAIAESVRLLAGRKSSRRSVIIVIGEAKDRSSKLKIEEVVSRAQAANIVVYPVSYSAYLTAFTSKGAEQFRSGRRVYEPGGGMNLLAVFHEIGRAGSKNGHEVLAQYTGGLKSSFVKLKGLEETLQRVGEDLHSQYLLSFRPPAYDSDTGTQPAYREIRVRVRGCPECQVRHRPGYWRTAGD
jgi:VWFA-related protein